jgi:hypothetical protein
MVMPAEETGNSIYEHLHVNGTGVHNQLTKVESSFTRAQKWCVTENYPATHQSIRT